MYGKGMSKQQKGQIPLDQTDQMTIKLLSRKISRENKKIERLLGGIRLAIYADLEIVKRELLQNLRQVESEVELIARELTRKNGGESANSNGSLH